MKIIHFLTFLIYVHMNIVIHDYQVEKHSDTSLQNLKYLFKRSSDSLCTRGAFKYVQYRTCLFWFRWRNHALAFLLLCRSKVLIYFSMM